MHSWMVWWCPMFWSTIDSMSVTDFRHRGIVGVFVESNKHWNLTRPGAISSGLPFNCCTTQMQNQFPISGLPLNWFTKHLPSCCFSWFWIFHAISSRKWMMIPFLLLNDLLSSGWQQNWVERACFRLKFNLLHSYILSYINFLAISPRATPFLSIGFHSLHLTC